MTARKQADLLREEQALVLEMIAMNAPLGEVLDRLVRLMETQLQGVLGSILLLDEDGSHLRHGAAPKLAGGLFEGNRRCCHRPGRRLLRHRRLSAGSRHRRRYLERPAVEELSGLAAHYGLRSCWSTPILSHQGAVLGTFAMYSKEVREPGAVETRLTEMTTRIAAIAIERKRAEDQISFLAHHDALTGLPNRSLLKDRLTQAMLQTQRHNPWVSVVFVDLDNFKTVNDSLGHTAGDALLKVVADRMVDCVKATDTVVRLGGDEFVILLVDQPESADAISATLRQDPGGHRRTGTD